MDSTQIILLIVFSILDGISILWGILLQFRILTILIPGYNRHAKSNQGIFFEKVYARYVGIFIIILSLFFGGVFAGLIFHYTAIVASFGAAGSIFAVGGIFYLTIKPKPRMAKLLAIAVEEDPEFIIRNEIDISIFKKKD